MVRAVKTTFSARFRRITAGALLFVMLSPSIAFAILPLGFGIGIVAGIAQSGLTIPIAMGTASIGAIVAMVTLHNSSTTPTASNQAITAMINPKAEPPKRPAGWAAPASGSIQPQAPASVTSTPATSQTLWRLRNSSATITYVTGAASSNDACVAWGPVSGPTYYAQVESGACKLRRVSDSALMGTAYMSSYVGLGCPSGTVLTGTDCLTTVPAGPAQKPSDGHCSIVRTGNSFSADPFDTEDCVGATSANHITISGDSKSLTATRDDGSKIEVRLQDDGTSVVIDTRPVSPTTTKQTSVSLSAPDPVTGESKVTGTKTEQFQGTGTSQSSTPNATVDVNLDTTGLASEGTQLGIKSTLEGIGDSLTPGAGDDGSLLAESAALDAAATAHEGLFSGSATTGDHGLTWDWFPTIPASGACSNPTIDMLGKPMTINFCTAAAVTREALSWLVYIFGSIMILNILTGRKAD